MTESEVPEIVCYSSDWTSIAAFCVALAALAVSILTVYLRDSYRGRLRVWVPKPERGLPQDAGDPHVDIVNMSPFDIRVSELYLELGTGERYHLPGPFGDADIEFPLDISARRSVRVGLHFTSFYGVAGKSLTMIAETDTGKKLYPACGMHKHIKRYVETVVAEQEALADEKQRETIRNFSAAANRQNSQDN